MKNCNTLLFRLFVFILPVSIIILSACEKPKPVLKDAYKNLFYIGTALNQNQILGNDSNAIAVVKNQFNSISPENDMKWEKIHPQPAIYDFTAADSFVNFGINNNMFIVGH
jgi:endo-1,4-beta-xylanase